jgi:hypothetical protein
MNMGIGKGRHQRPVPENNSLRSLGSFAAGFCGVGIADEHDAAMMLDEIPAHGMPCIAGDDRSFVNRHLLIGLGIGGSNSAAGMPTRAFSDGCDDPSRALFAVNKPAREVWAERALKCGYPERFAQQALGHNSKAVHHAYAKHAEVTVPSLDDWEKNWRKAECGRLKAEGEGRILDGGYQMPKPAVVQVDFQAQRTGAARGKDEIPAAVGAGRG